MWQETKNGLYREFEFKDFNAAFDFMQRVAGIAEKLGHHPRWENNWNKVNIWLSTHSDGGQITDKDHELSKRIDEVYNREEMAEAADKDTTNTKGPDSLQAAANSPGESDKIEPLKQREIKMFADGGSRGNPGPSASGFVLLDMQDQVLFKGGLYLGITTNNQAEYHAVRLGLEEALKRGAREVNVFLDSLLVVNQMKGIFKVKNRDLWPIHQAIKELVKQFKRVNFTHVPREFNKLADGMVNEVLDNTDLTQA